MMTPDWLLLTLPDAPCSLTLARDCSFDGADLDRFVAVGGVVRANGWRVFVSGGCGAAALAMLMGAVSREVGAKR